MNYIVYAADDNYAKQLSVSLYSLLKHNSDLDIYILDNGISKKNKSIMKELTESHGESISFIDITNIEELLPAKVDVNQLSLSTYARLFLTELLPRKIDYILYLDCDTYINDRLDDLFSLDISSYSVAGVEDTMYPSYKIGAGLNLTDRYINAGILYINLKRWREKKLLAVFNDFIIKHKGKVPHLDQGVINGTITDKYYLQLKYNVQSTVLSFKRYKDLLAFFSLEAFYSEEEIQYAKKSPVIIHYTSFFLQRPWLTFCLHPYKKLYINTAMEIFPDIRLQKSRIGIINKLKCILFKYLQEIYLKLR